MMYIDANDVKLYMELDVHKQIADFINKSVEEAQRMYLTEIERRMQALIEQEIIGETMSDVGIGMLQAIGEVREIYEELEQLNNQNDYRWIPCITERYPESGKYVLLSFANFSVPCVGRYEEDENGGAFYIGDEDETCTSHDLIVNAWMPLPKGYEE